MRAMPNPPRTEGLDHEVAVAALQKWLWACTTAERKEGENDIRHTEGS